MARTKTSSRKRAAARRGEDPHSQGVLLKIARDRYKKRIEGAEDEIDEMGRDQIELKDAYDLLKQNHSKLQADHEDLRGEYIAKSKLLDDKELEVHDYKSCSKNLQKDQKIAELESRIFGLERDKARLLKQAENKEDQISELRRRSPRSNVDSADITRLRHQRNEARATIDELDAEIAKEKSSRTVTENKLNEWKQNWETLFGEQVDLKEELKVCRSKLKEKPVVQQATNADQKLADRATSAEKNVKALLDTYLECCPLVEKLAKHFKENFKVVDAEPLAAGEGPRGPLPCSSTTNDLKNADKKVPAAPVTPSDPTWVDIRPTSPCESAAENFKMKALDVEASSEMSTK